MIELTLEEHNQISVRPDVIRTVQDGINPGDLTCITLDDGEVYLVYESRHTVLQKIALAKEQANG